MSITNCRNWKEDETGIGCASWECKYEPGWISIEDELPENEDVYLVTWTGELGRKTFGPFIELIDYFPATENYKEEWCTGVLEKKGYKNIKILAWMPAPEPYKG